VEIENTLVAVSAVCKKYRNCVPMVSDLTLSSRVVSVKGVQEPQVPAAVQQPLGQEARVHTQAPPWHSTLLPHDVPFAAFGVEQAPVLVSQVPSILQAAGAGHALAGAEPHTPAVHVSAVQALLSMFEQAVPFVLFGYVHFPVAELHVPGLVWHWSAALHVTFKHGSALHAPMAHPNSQAWSAAV
jgi:hypothetical protein